MMIHFLVHGSLSEIHPPMGARMVARTGVPAGHEERGQPFLTDPHLGELGGEEGLVIGGEREVHELEKHPGDEQAHELAVLEEREGALVVEALNGNLGYLALLDGGQAIQHDEHDERDDDDGGDEPPYRLELTRGNGHVRRVHQESGKIVDACHG